MRSRWYARVPHALVLAGLVSSLGAASAWGNAGDNGQYFMIEGLWLSKDDGDTIPFTALDGGVTPGAVPFALVTTDDLDIDDAGGLRATIQFDAWGQGWQASAFGGAGFEGDFFITGLDPASGDTDTTYADFNEPGGFGSGDPENSDELHALALHLESDLWGAEFSWVKNLSGYGWNKVDFLFGVRYLHYGEELDSQAYDSPNDLVFDDDIDSLTINVDNDLVGLQIGLQGMWNVSSNVAIGGTLKGGVAANFVSRDRSFIDRDDVPSDFAYADNHDDTGFAQFAEFNPRIDVALSDTATLTFAGTVLWINETARAASHYETVADTTDANLRDDDDELFYGASVGLRLALN